jgi:hypothetical protein
VYFFCQAVYTFLKISSGKEKIFRRLLQVNFFLCLIAIPCYFTPRYDLFWDEQTLRNGVGALRRLKMFTYEPSYYALLFTPVFCFFLLQYLFRQNKIRGIALLLMLFLPLILSASVGVVAALMIAGILTGIIHFKKLFSKRRILNATSNTGLAAVSMLLFTFFLFRNNPVFTRIANIISGEDSSGKGRTADAFILAQKMLGEDHRFWGIGLGQIKIAGNDLIRDYYLYNMDLVVTIPNAVAETLAIFGWPGLLLRLLAQCFLFYITKVWSNYYRLLLFLFMFIYQFTGSFITNSAEYVIWILAFTNVFDQFDVRPRRSSRNEAASAV